MPPRYLYRFTSIDENTVLTFPLVQYEWESSQDQRLALSPAVGAHYAHDHQVRAASPRDPARESVRAMVSESSAGDIDTELANIRARAIRIGLGKLWTKDEGDNLRWAYARPVATPGMTLRWDQVEANIVPVNLDWERLSDWFEETKTTGSTTVSSSPHDFTINNPGDLPAYAIVFRFRSDGASGFTDPKLLNLANAYEFESTRDAVDTDSELRVDTDEHDVEWSTDNGSSYSDDYGNFSIGDAQVQWMVLEPGDNSMRYTDGGTPNLTIEWSFYAPHAT